VHLLVTISADRFDDLCRYGGAIEDLEDTHDAEDPGDDLEPSIGGAGMDMANSIRRRGRPALATL
jgi:hypothetical protein